MPYREEYTRLIEVTTLQLLSRLTENKKTHIAVFEDAIKDWQQDLAAKATAFADDPENDELFEKLEVVRQAKPKSQEQEYDNAITQITFEVRETVNLSQDEANAFLNDYWHWKERAMNNGYFSASTQKMSMR